MSNKNLGIVLAVIGLLILVVIVLEPSIGLGTIIGYGTKHTLALIVGVVAVVAGIFMFLRKGKA